MLTLQAPACFLKTILSFKATTSSLICVVVVYHVTKCTCVVEEMWTYANRLRSTHCRVFSILNNADPLSSLEITNGMAKINDQNLFLTKVMVGFFLWDSDHNSGVKKNVFMKKAILSCILGYNPLYSVPLLYHSTKIRSILDFWFNVLNSTSD